MTVTGDRVSDRDRIDPVPVPDPAPDAMDGFADDLASPTRCTAVVGIMDVQVRRSDDLMLDHERTCFIASAGLEGTFFDW